MATKHFFKGVAIFLVIIVLGLIIFSYISNSDKGTSAGINTNNKAEVAK
ncbi:MAG: hypothetical protein WC847_03385 [Candidatus Paceibacterota bacterium]|jgi:hypothetical protein